MAVVGDIQIHTSEVTYGLHPAVTLAADVYLAAVQNGHGDDPAALSAGGVLSLFFDLYEEEVMHLLKRGRGRQS